jgi:hypothetical protein
MKVGRGFVQQHLDAGVHPATGRPLLRQEEGEGPPPTCGSCLFLVARALKDGSIRLKCGFKRTRRRGLDLRPNYPACDVFEPGVACRAEGGFRNSWRSLDSTPESAIALGWFTASTPEGDRVPVPPRPGVADFDEAYAPDVERLQAQSWWDSKNKCWTGRRRIV